MPDSTADERYISLPQLSEAALTSLAWDSTRCGWGEIRDMVDDERRRRDRRE